MTGFEAIEPIPPPFGVTFKGSGFCGPIPCILDRFDSEWMEEDRGVACNSIELKFLFRLMYRIM